MYWHPPLEPLATYRYWQAADLTQADVIEGLGGRYRGETWDEVYAAVRNFYRYGPAT